MQNTEFRTGVIRPVECYKEAWELIKNQYWLLLAVTIIGIMIGGASMYIVLGAMMCGMFYCYFQAIDGKKVESITPLPARMPATLLAPVPAVSSSIKIRTCDLL